MGRFHKALPKVKSAYMLLSKILPQTSTKFTQIYLPYLWHYATLVPKMALRVPESKFWDHFIYLILPQNPQKDTLGIGIGPRKVIFGHFTFYIDILAPFLECKQLCKPRMPNFAVDLWSDLDSENCSEISAVTYYIICLKNSTFLTFVFFTPP